jgi:hypothetical protein
MATQLDDRQIVNRAPLSALGNTANLTLDVIMGDINTFFANATSNATASVLMERDANANTRANNFIEGFTTTATAAVTTTLTVASTYFQQFTGTNTQTVVLPNATTLVVGQSFVISNRSTGNVTVQTNGGANLQVLTANSQSTFTVSNIGTSAGTWDVAYTVTGPIQFLQTQVTTDSTTTGSAATTLTADTNYGTVRLTNGSLVSVSGIVAGASGQYITIENQTGNLILINNNDSGATAANRILTGTGSNVTMSNNASFTFVYDTTQSRWMLVGGTGSGSGSGTGKNYLSSIVTSQSTTPNTGNGNFELGSTTGWSTFSTSLTTFTQTVTITNASPAVFTTPSAHGFAVGQTLYFTTTGALPTGLTASQSYYITAVPSTTTFNVSATPAGSNVNTSSAGSGTHTLHYNPIPSGAPGSPDGSITTFSATNAGRLIAGSYSLLTAASGAMTAGQGFITNAFYIDAEDTAKAMTVKFYYNFYSGGLYQPGNSSNTFAVYIYDVTNAVWIQPAGVYGMNVSVSSGVNTPSYCTATFQTSANSTQYQLAIVAINQWQGTFGASWDDFSVGPQTAPLGVPQTDWVNDGAFQIGASTTAPTYGTATITINQRLWKREGQNMRVRWYFEKTASGTATAGSGVYLFPINASYQIDTSLFTADTGTSNSANVASPRSNMVGIGAGTASTTQYFSGFTSVYNSQNVTLNFVQDVNSGSGSVESTTVGGGANAITTAAAMNYVLEAVVPIVGWSSNVQMSSDTDTRSVVLVGTSASVTVSSSDTTLTASRDTHGGWSGSHYTVPVSGDYQISASGVCSTLFTLNVAINGTNYSGGSFSTASSSGYVSSGAFIAYSLPAGTTISLRGGAGSVTVTSLSFSIHRISGPATIAATESVNMVYNTSTTAGSASVNYIYTNKIRDSHNGYNVTTGKYTVPVSGFYSVCAGINSAGAVTADLGIRQNGTVIFYGGEIGALTNMAVAGMWPFNAGDIIDVVPTSAVTANTSANVCYFMISRLGN